MPGPLIDLLWREHPDAPSTGSRGPRARHSLSDVVSRAMALADESGLGSLTMRSLAASLGVSPMSIYTHVTTRADLVVLMADAAHAGMPLPSFGRSGWRRRATRTAEANLALFLAHRWLLDVRDPRVALGPGTITKYDHELHIFDGTPLDDVQRDAALTFLLDFVASSAASRLESSSSFEPIWAQSAAGLQHYLADGFPLARRIGQAAGEHMGAPYSASQAWAFGLDRVLAGLAEIIEADEAHPGPHRYPRDDPARG
ncbi:TetR/AcrR family transcriptional regulator [Acidipropionibacterium virtanenii]|uniref:Tetracycline repressor protein class E n=1 Tax=Acidipropionibacterium virtanenii TaxID=2057246 RepID=A0A344URX7_9ACTN|nr:TetR/AcrR family transcriptional regulator C-terminal domain-containing protein [Acidipropionibacterium virtanenii]AXE38025.1 Tetracycline repressor protein class E [Acidipropionibacterium virtanenii]